MFLKKADTKVNINELIATRWSGRAFDPDREINNTALLALLEAARWAPSCYGDQPWRFIIFNRKNKNTAWEKAISCLSEGNQSWAINAPVLILVVACTIISRNGQPNYWGKYDTGAAAMNMCIQATELGLMVHQMGGFDRGKARNLFSIPEAYNPMAMMALGYQLPREKIPESIVERETAERARLPLTELAYDAHWGNPVNL